MLNLKKKIKPKTTVKPTVHRRNYSCACVLLCITDMYNTAQNSSDKFPS